MKTIQRLLPVILFITAFSNFIAAQQSMHVTYTGFQGSANVPIDSLVIRNLSQGSDTVLYHPDTVLYFLWAGIHDQQNSGDLGSGPYPNPCNGKTLVSVFLERRGRLSWELSAVSGKKLLSSGADLSAGNHSLEVSLPDAGTYILRLEWPENRQGYKIISSGTGEHSGAQICYKGLSEKPNGHKLPTTINTLNFIPGDILSTVGYAGNLTAQSINKVDSTILVTLHFAPACLGIPSLTYEGFEYHTVQIADQCWLRENLRPGMMIASSSAQSNNLTVEKYCYQNEPDNCLLYGGLYTWKEMMKYSYVAGSTGICPAGFHIPTEAEWNRMQNYLDNFPGGKLKNQGNTYWLAPNTGASDEVGFDALGAGFMDQMRDFYDLKQTTRFWTSSNVYNSFGITRCIDADRAGVYPYGYGSMEFSYSVRCIKDCDPVAAVNAGPDQTLVYGTHCQLSANNPAPGESGVWTIVSGGLGYFSNTHDPNALFTGSWYGPYTLRWTLSNPCTSNSDQVQIAYFFDVCPGIPQVTYGNQSYSTVQIGRQCWFRENLNIGSQLPYTQDQLDNGQIEKYCYNNDPAHCTTYGGLYQWDELMQYDTLEGIQGICPQGWHIPTVNDFETLMDYLGGQGTAGGKMKQAGNQTWNFISPGATNISGMEVLGAGCRVNTGSFFYYTESALIWTSDVYDNNGAYTLRLLAADDQSVINNVPRTYGNSVRCLKD